MRGVFAASLAATIFAFVGVLVVLINRDEVNSFEITFFRGIIQFLTTFCYDIFETKFKRNKVQNNSKNTSNNCHNSNSHSNCHISEEKSQSDNSVARSRNCNEENEREENYTFYETNSCASLFVVANDTSASNSIRIAKNSNASMSTSLTFEKATSQFEEPLDGSSYLFDANNILNSNSTVIDINNDIFDQTNGKKCNAVKKERLRLIELLSLYSWNRTLKWTFSSSFFSGITICCYYYSLTLLSLGNAIGVYNIFPVFSFFIAYLVLREPLKRIQLLILLFAMIGVVLIAQPTFLFGDFSSNSSNNKQSNESESLIMFGYAICILGAITQALSMIFTRKLKNIGNDILLGTLYIHAVALAFWGLFGSVVIFGSVNLRHFNVLVWIYLNLIGILGFVGVLLLNYSLLKLAGGYASLIRSMDVVIGYILQIVILNDSSFNFITILGVCSIMVPIGTYAIWKGYNSNKSDNNNNKNNAAKTKLNESELDQNEIDCVQLDRSRESERILMEYIVQNQDI